MRKLPLTAVGVIVVLAGLVSKLVMSQVSPPTNRSELLGQGLAQMMLLVAGVVTIGVGLVRDRRGG